MELAVEWLLPLALKSTVVLGCGALCSFALARSSAAIRHLMWAATMGALLLLPLLEASLPEWRPSAPGGTIAGSTRMPMIIEVLSESPVKAPTVAWPISAIWALGCGLALAKTALGATRAIRIVRHADVFEVSKQVLISPDVTVPCVCGVLRPRIVIPQQARSWTALRMRMVLKHKRMHIARNDTRIQMLAQAVCALYWPNPLVWSAAARLRREAERACDDGVLEEGESAAAYADELVQIVIGLRGATQRFQGEMTMGRGSGLESRIKALLRSGSDRRKTTPRTVAAACFLSLIVLLPLSALRAPAQQAGSIVGVVIDPTGAAVPRAKVTVSRAGSDRKEFFVTDEKGEFTVQPMPEGSYVVTVAKQGFALLRLEGISVKAGNPTRVQAALNLGRVAENLEVSGKTSLPGSTSSLPTEAGGYVQRPKLVSAVKPVYPPECKSAGIEGIVALRAVIGRDGGISKLEQVNELVDSRLAQAGIEAVRQWRYEPTYLNGNPVETITDIEINFLLGR